MPFDWSQRRSRSHRGPERWRHRDAGRLRVGAGEALELFQHQSAGYHVHQPGRRGEIARPVGERPSSLPRPLPRSHCSSETLFGPRAFSTAPRRDRRKETRVLNGSSFSICDTFQAPVRCRHPRGRERRSSDRRKRGASSVVSRHRHNSLQICILGEGRCGHKHAFLEGEEMLATRDK